MPWPAPGDTEHSPHGTAGTQASQGLRRPFTAFVDVLVGGGAPPSPALFESVLGALRSALVYEIGRLDLWRGAPRRLGVLGGGSRWSGEHLEELLLDAYTFLFLRRLDGLAAQRRIRGQVDGMVYHGLYGFLIERRRRYAPLSERAFEIAHHAIEQLCEEGRLRVIDGDPRIGHETVLAFAGWHDPREAERVRLDAQVASWSSELLPELSVAHLREAGATLARYVARLPEHGVQVFRFRALLEPLEDDLRARWRSVLVSEETADPRGAVSGLGELVAEIRPRTGVEGRDAHAALVSCVEGRLAAWVGGERARRELECLWIFLREWAGDPAARELSLSASRGAKILGISPDRLPELRHTLGEVTTRCSAAACSALAILGEKTVVVGLAARREALRQSTGAALMKRHVAAGGGSELIETAEPGGLWVSAATRSWPIEWLVTEHSEDGRSLQVVPVDGHPVPCLLDVTLPGGAARVRSGAAEWVPASALESAELTGRITDGLLAEVCRRIAGGGGVEPPLGAVGRAWQDELELARAALRGRPIRPEAEALSEASHETSTVTFAGAEKEGIVGWTSWHLALAIAVAVSAGLLLGLAL